MKKSICFIILFFVVSLFAPTESLAAKKFVPKTTSTAKIASSGSIPSVVRYRADRLGILLSFFHFNNLESVSYSFTYIGNGQSQGVGGTIKASNNPTEVRELLFGTCSSGVCTYHSNLTNARLVLTVRHTNGTTSTKSYKIKTYR